MFGSGIFGSSPFGGEAPEFSAVLTALSLTAVLTPRTNGAALVARSHDGTMTVVPNTYSVLFTFPTNGAVLSVEENSAALDGDSPYTLELTNIYRL